jgi:signal transduction histidine kinase
LARFTNGRFTNWTERDGLPSKFVRALYEDRDGVLWIGTYDGGLGRFKDGKFTRYTVREGMFDNGVFQILEDDRGQFWMSSNRGIHRVNKRELNEFAEGRRRAITSVSYGKSDGMLNAECNGGCWPAGLKTRDGKLWFPTQEGAAVIDPQALPTNSQPPSVVIEAVLLDRSPVAAPRESAADFPAQNNGALTRRPAASPLRIPPDNLDLEIQYTALSFINSERLRFKYQLKGWDHDWVEAGTRRAAYYSHVEPGHYTFTVLAANSDGVWNETGASLALVVLPAWYETWWFRALLAAALAGVTFAFYRARIRRLQREQAAQQQFSRGLIESEEQERKRIAAELHDSLGQNLLVIKNRAAMAKSPGASTSQELDEIARLAAQSIEEVREISQNLRPYQLDRLGLTRALHGLVKKVSASSKLKCAAYITPVDRVFASEAETNLFRIVQEALNNVLKHSGATEARVVVERDETQVRLLIEDNGRGFDPNSRHDGRWPSPLDAASDGSSISFNSSS